MTNLNLLPPILLYPSSTSLLHLQLYLPLSPSGAAGMGNWSCRTLHNTQILLLLPPCAVLLFQGEVPHMGYKSFTNCSSMGHLHVVQSFSNRLLQHKSSLHSTILLEQTALVQVPHEPQLPLENLLLCGFLSISQERATMAAASFRAYPLASAPLVLHGEDRDGLSMDCRGIFCSSAYSTSSHFSYFCASQGFLPFLKYIFRGELPAWLLGSPVIHGGSVLKQLELVVSSTGYPLVYSQRDYPLQNLHCQNLICKLSTDIF